MRLIVSNKRGTHYSRKDLESSAKALSFAYKLMGRSEATVRATVGPCDAMPGHDECELEARDKEVSFLLTNSLEADLHYFAYKYLPGLPDVPIKDRRYHIDSICVLDFEEDLYEIRISFEEVGEFPNPRVCWNDVIGTSTKGLVETWIKINSLYRQIRHRDTQPSALIYLEVLHDELQGLGATHLDYIGVNIQPGFKAEYRVDANVFKTHDEAILADVMEGCKEAEKRRSDAVRAYHYLQDLTASVFFDPSLQWRCVRTEDIEGKVKFRAMTSTLVEIFVRWLPE